MRFAFKTIRFTLRKRQRNQINIFPFLTIGFWLLQSPNFAQSPTPTPPSPTAYRFQTETVWAKLSIVVIDFKDHFQIECQSDNAIEGWNLEDHDSGKAIANSDNNDGDSFKVNIDKPFTDDELTVFVEGESMQIPMVIDLEPEKDKLYKLKVYTPFQENPNRPYNTLVKSLYEQAGLAYSQSDTKSALATLQKAEDIDPTEPQVLEFMSKLQTKAADNSTEKYIADCLAKAQKAEANNNAHEAKNWYLEVLKVDAKNQTALDGINRLQAQLLEQAAKLIEKNIKDGDYDKAKNILAKIKLSFPNEVRIKQWQDQIDQLANSPSPSDRKAKADAAYNLGLDSYRKDDFASAKKFWEEALQIDPQYLQARQNLDRLNQDHPGL